MKTIRLGDYIHVKHGFAFDGNHIITNDNGIVLTTPGNFTLSGGFKEDNGKFYNGNYPNEYILNAGDLIVTLTDLSKMCDTLGFSAIIPKTNYIYLHNQRIGLVTILDETVIYKDYLYWVMRSKTYRQQIVNTASGGSTVHHTSPNKIYDVKVDIPDTIAEQKQIAHILSNIDTKIALNNSICADLESVAKEIYDYWFTQFDFPDENGKPYKSSGGKMVWSDELKREIPQGWRTCTLKEISSIYTTSTTPIDDRNYYHYSIPAFDENHVPVYESGNHIDSNKYIVESNSILVSKLNPQFQRVWFIQDANDNSVCSTEFIPFKSSIGNIGFLYMLLMSDSFHKYMVQCSSSSTGSRKRMQPELCYNYVFAFPNDKSIVDKFSSITEKSLSIIEKKIKENQELTSLRDWLLPMLMNGQVGFKDAE